MLTGHAWERVAERLTPDERDRVTRSVQTFVRQHPTGDHAVRVLRLPAMRGVAWSDVSNGEDVWAVVRDGRVCTVMLRRKTQPATSAALRVESVWSVK